MNWVQQSTQWLRDPQGARIAELQALGEHRVAGRIRACGQLITTSVQHKVIAAFCNRRECPRCVAKTLYPRYRRKILTASKAMARPLSLRFSFASHGEMDLAATISQMRVALAAARRLKSMRGVRSGVGMLHPNHAVNERWNLHVHVLMDAPETFDIEALEVDWSRVTRGWGHVALRPANPAKGRHKAGDPGKLEEAASYIAHSGDWAPENGSMSQKRYDQLRQAIEGRQLLVSWGTGRRGRREQCLTAGNVSTPALRVGSDLVAAHAQLVAEVRAQHARGETVRWDKMEKRDEVKVDVAFDLGADNETDSAYVVSSAVREVQHAEGFKAAAAVEALSVKFLALGLRGDASGRARLVRYFAEWLRLPLVEVRPLRPITRRPTARQSFRLADGRVDARGDWSQLDIVLGAIAQAMLMLKTRDTARGLELLALVHLVGIEHDEHDIRPCPPERMTLILASLRRTLCVAPVDTKPRRRAAPSISIAASLSAA